MGSRKMNRNLPMYINELKEERQRIAKQWNTQKQRSVGKDIQLYNDSAREELAINVVSILYYTALSLLFLAIVYLTGISYRNRIDILESNFASVSADNSMRKEAVVGSVYRLLKMNNSSTATIMSFDTPRRFAIGAFRNSHELYESIVNDLEEFESIGKQRRDIIYFFPVYVSYMNDLNLCLTVVLRLDTARQDAHYMWLREQVRDVGSYLADRVIEHRRLPDDAAELGMAIAVTSSKLRLEMKARIKESMKESMKLYR
jgi:hypothetical protein